MTADERYRVTLDAIGAGAGLIAIEVRSVGRTIDALEDAFAGITGEGTGEGFGGFGLIGLPLMATWTAIKKAAEQYVGQQTGQSLTDWMTFVEAASEQFDGYASVLDSLQAFAVSRSGPDAAPVDEADLERLRDVRHTTQAWKVVLGRVSQIGRLVDAVLAVQRSEDSVAAETAPDSRPTWTMRKVQDKLTDAMSQTGISTTELREWLFRPLVDLRDQVQELPETVSRLADEVAVLEVKLELAIAQLEAQSGLIAAGDVEIIRMRVAGTVLLPALRTEFDRVESRRSEVQVHRSRLEELHAKGEIGDEVRDRIDELYAAELARIDEQQTGLADNLAAWRTDGPQAVADCLSWIDAELGFLRGRRLVEGEGPLDQRIVLLNIEHRRLRSVRDFLDRNGR